MPLPASTASRSLVCGRGVRAERWFIMRSGAGCALGRLSGLWGDLWCCRTAPPPDMATDSPRPPTDEITTRSHPHE